jgi:electron transport complex protein RnfC
VESLFEQVQNGRLWPLTGGIHPPSHKEITSSQPISQLPIPAQLIVPLKQHIGIQGKLLVAQGDTVLKGQPLTQPVQGLSLPVHAPTSGTITKIESHPIAHPSALSEPCIFIEPDGEDSWVDREPLPHFREETPEFLVEKIKMAGISGLGGAGFPAYVKSKSLRKVNYLIINATECEPYITADDTLIQRDAQTIIQGIDIVASIVNPDMIIVGIEDDKPAAIKSLKLATEHRDDIHIRVFPSKYPSGGEKQLINILTGQQVPSGGIAIDIGILVHNIGTLHAIYKAVVCDEPLISRIVTVTGGAVKSPQNVEVLVGTPINDLLQYCDFSPSKKQRVIMGGPMMGFTLSSTAIPVVKISNCILAPQKNELPAPENEMECIRCSACADACPVKLLPQQLLWYSKAKDHAEVEAYNLKDCIECGACAYVCPSEIPLVQYYRVAKAEIKAENLEKQLAEKAKERYEARTLRLERDTQEREEKQRLASEKRKQALAKSGGKNAVADALARVKAKKAKQAAEAGGAGSSTDVSASADSTEQKPLTGAAAAIAKAKERKRKQAEAAELPEQSRTDNNSSEPEPEQKQSRTDNKESEPEVKAEAESTEAQSWTDKDGNPLKGAALAVAKAKERKRKLAELEQNPTDTPDPEAQKAAAKKAAVAAVVAKARAKKLAKQRQSQDDAAPDSKEDSQDQ